MAASPRSGHLEPGRFGGKRAFIWAAFEGSGLAAWEKSGLAAWEGSGLAALEGSGHTGMGRSGHGTYK